MTRRTRVAVAAFVGHGFGLLFVGEPMGPQLRRHNAFAIAATIAGVAAFLAFGSAERRGILAWAAFLVGHFAWGTYLAVRVHRR